jgi:predicted nucleic acid-binding protein
LLVAERRQRFIRARTARFVQTLTALPIRVDPVVFATVWGAVLDVGRDYRLSAYDASYLELANREALPLASLDARLLGAARRAGLHRI